MTWEDFVAKVKENLLEESNRLGTETFLTNQIRLGVIDLQDAIPQFKVGHVTNYDPDDLKYQGAACLGNSPERSEIKEAWIVKTGTPVSRQPLDIYPWDHRHDLFAGDVSVIGYAGRIAMDPGSTSFVIHPAITDSTHLEVTWDGRKLEFSDEETVIFDEQEAEAVAYFVRWKCAVPISSDMKAAEYWKGEYFRAKRDCYLAAKRRTEIKTITDSPQKDLCYPLTAVEADGLVEFVFTGDTGILSTITDTATIASALASDAPDFFIHGGDLSELSSKANLQEYFTRYFGSQVDSEDLYVAIGEKDLDSNNGDDVLAAIPYLEDLNSGKLYYSVLKGDAEFFFLNGNKLSNGSTAISADGVGSGSDQETWLVAAIDASTAAWKVVVIHNAPYTSDAALTPGVTAWRLDYPGMGADLVLSSHSKTYERLMVCGINYIVCGLGGAPVGSFGSQISGSQVIYNDRPGFVKAAVTSTRFRIDFMNIDGFRIDSVVLSK